MEQFHDFDSKRVLEKTEKDKKVNQETAAAEEFRNKALETIGESTTRKRNKSYEDEDSSDSGLSKRKTLEARPWCTLKRKVKMKLNYEKRN